MSRLIRMLKSVPASAAIFQKVLSPFESLATPPVSLQFATHAASPECAPFTTRVGRNLYTILSHVEGKLPVDSVTGPSTVLCLPKNNTVSESWLKSTIDQLVANDDVYSKDFLAHVVFCIDQSQQQPIISQDARSVLTAWNSSLHFVPQDGSLRDGPYYLLASQIHKVYKLYADPYGAFMTGVLHDEAHHGRYLEYPGGLIPVPSRSYYGEPSAARPLEGQRIGLKDMFDLAGTSTSASSRAYLQLYPPANTTASAVQKLIDKGAIIVGKTKTSQFASGEDPKDWIDFQCSFNPRGDGYLTTTGSSVGSAVCLAAYAWMDGSIGTDTFGSMISPACAQGVFGIRPTYGILEVDGVVPFASSFDTPGHFSRDISSLLHFGQTWYGETVLVVKDAFPSKIWYPPSRFENFHVDQLKIMEGFIKDLEGLIGVKRTILDENAEWDAHADKDLGRPHSDFLNTTTAYVQLFEGYHAQDGFRKSYEEKFGHAPYLDPMVRWKWQLASTITKEQYSHACEEKNAFRNFVRNNILDPGSILILPGGMANQLWRDDFLGTPDEVGPQLQGYGFGLYSYSVLGGAPQIAVPVGQWKLTSKVLEVKVDVPVSLIIVGPPGSDTMLIELVKKILQESGRPSIVSTGKSAFGRVYEDGEDKLYEYP